VAASGAAYKNFGSASLVFASASIRRRYFTTKSRIRA
jgi:hypothetical protein